MFYFIGLGLGDAEDITVKGLKIVKTAKRVYLESYTSIITGGKEKLEEFYGRDIILADREMVEQNSDEILRDADKEDVALLIVGDPFGATTHTDFILRAKELNIEYTTIHNASIMNAVGCCGLQLYQFGQTVSIVFWTETSKPDSFYDKIAVNRKNGFHTLCLLDIKVKEQSIENLMRGRKIYEPPRYMSCSQAAEQLLEIIENKRDEGQNEIAFTEETICVGLGRVGCPDQKIVAARLKDFTSIDMGEPLHSFVITGNMHLMELEMLKMFTYDPSILE